MKEAKVKSYKNVYAKDPDATVQRVRTYHLNDEEETEVEREDTLDGMNNNTSGFISFVRKY